MKNPFLYFIYLVTVYAVASTIAFLLVFWLVSPTPISLFQVKKYCLFGVVFGLIGGSGVWILYYINSRR